MKGTAILFQQDHGVIFLEDIDKSAYEEMRRQCGSDHCLNLIGEKKVDYGNVSNILWYEEDIDWAYGY